MENFNSLVSSMENNEYDSMLPIEIGNDLEEVDTNYLCINLRICLNGWDIFKCF